MLNPSLGGADVLVQKFGRLEVLDDLIRLRALDEFQCPILAYPKHAAADFEYFTGRDLDRFIDQGAKKLIARGFEPVRSLYIFSPTGKGKCQVTTLIHFLEARTVNGGATGIVRPRFYRHLLFVNSSWSRHSLVVPSTCPSCCSLPARDCGL